MQIEYEATFANINKDEIRGRLRAAGAELLKPEFMQKRVVLDFPTGHEVENGFIRVRDEGDRITTSLKVIHNGNIETQQELCLVVDNFDTAVSMLERIGCQKKAYQETKREIWTLDDVEVCIDEWPYLEPFVEAEGKSEEKVKQVSEELGFDYSKALFCAVGHLYELKYGINERNINYDFPLITFDMENPFIKFKKS